MKESDGSSKGCGFVKFKHKESAILSIKFLNAQAYLLEAEKPIEVRFAEKKKQNTSQSNNTLNSNSGIGINQMNSQHQQPSFQQPPMVLIIFFMNFH